MKGKQLEIIRVIEFPRNKQIEELKRNKKLDVAIRMLECLTEEGADFHIILSRKDTLKLFEDNGKVRDYLIMTSNLEKGQKLKINSENSNVYVIEGDELD